MAAAPNRTRVVQQCLDSLERAGAKFQEELLRGPARAERRRYEERLLRSSLGWSNPETARDFRVTDAPSMTEGVARLRDAVADIAAQCKRYRIESKKLDRLVAALRPSAVSISAVERALSFAGDDIRALIDGAESYSPVVAAPGVELDAPTAEGDAARRSDYVVDFDHIYVTVSGKRVAYGRGPRRRFLTVRHSGYRALIRKLAGRPPGKVSLPALSELNAALRPVTHGSVRLKRDRESDDGLVILGSVGISKACRMSVLSRLRPM